MKSVTLPAPAYWEKEENHITLGSYLEGWIAGRAAPEISGAAEISRRGFGERRTGEMWDSLFLRIEENCDQAAGDMGRR